MGEKNNFKIKEGHQRCCLEVCSHLITDGNTPKNPLYFALSFWSLFQIHITQGSFKGELSGILKGVLVS